MGRWGSSAGLTLVVGALTGTACGSGYEGVHPTPWYGEASATPRAPTEVAARLQGCAGSWGERHASAEYPVRLRVQVDEEGRVSAADVTSSTLRDAAVERCLAGALLGASFAASVSRLRTSGRLSGAPQGPEARALLGNPGALAAPAAEAAAEAAAAAAGVALSPVVITVGAVTLVVVITVCLAAKVIEGGEVESERERCRRVKQACIDKCTEEEIPTGEVNGDPFFRCRKDCMEAAGCW